MTRFNVDRLARKMDAAGVAGLVAATAENIAYLTGIVSVPLRMFPHTGQSFAVVARDAPGSPVFVSSACEVDQALDADVPLRDVLAHGTFYRELGPASTLTARDRELAQFTVDAPRYATPTGALLAALRTAGLAGERIAVDDDGVLPAVAAGIREAPGGPAATVPAGALLRDVRKVKTAAELDRVAAAAALAEAGIRAVAGVAAPGLTEIEMVRTFERAVVAGGGRPEFTLIKIGAGAVAGQTAPTLTKLERGDAIWFDVGCTLAGYWSDIARVYSLGEPAPRLAELYAGALAGADAAVATARPGMTGGELFNLVVETVRENGIPHYRRHHVGHGIGTEVYDRVLLTPDNTDGLETGTVVNVETPYYEFGLGAVHVEDPFVVCPGGNRLLTELDRGLQVID